jgi:adenine/guanine/hypoxanthine permease
VILGLPGHSGLLKLDVLGALKLGLVHVIFVFFFLDLFDTIGTLIGVSQQAGFLKHGRLPRARGALMADALGTVVGAGMGTSTVTSYVESAAGVADGARTGLANIVTALLFLSALFFSPLVQMIGGAYQQNLHPAIAPVLIIIGSIMVSNVTGIRWKDPTEALPAFLAMMLMPLTFSITEGIAFGFISYAFLKTVAGRHREVHWLVYLFAVLFIARYVYAGT